MMASNVGRTALLVAWLLISAAPALAHKMSLAYLEITPLAAGQFQVRFTQPAPAGTRPDTALHFPDNCGVDGEVVEQLRDLSYSAEYRLSCDGGLSGHRLAVENRPRNWLDVLVRYASDSEGEQIRVLTRESPVFVFDQRQGSAIVAQEYLVLGVEHILMGLDHLLFVLALLLLLDNRRALFWTITAFTLSHSLSLGLAVLGVVHAPTAAVEATIALSIVFVAAEIVQQRRGRGATTARHPYLVGGGFGLLHGLGFAGALSAIGLPEHAIPLALFAFNLGVEAGQLLFIGTVLMVGHFLRRVWPTLPGWLYRVPAYLIGSLAAYWTLQRLAAL